MESLVGTRMCRLCAESYWILSRMSLNRSSNLMKKLRSGCTAEFPRRTALDVPKIWAETPLRSLAKQAHVKLGHGFIASPTKYSDFSLAFLPVGTSFPPLLSYGAH